jgi:hypothetical protein
VSDKITLASGRLAVAASATADPEGAFTVIGSQAAAPGLLGVTTCLEVMTVSSSVLHTSYIPDVTGEFSYIC